MALSQDDIANRFGFHKATAETAPKHQRVRTEFQNFADFLSKELPLCRAASMAFTELESASMWANKAIAEQAPLDYDYKNNA